MRADRGARSVCSPVSRQAQDVPHIVFAGRAPDDPAGSGKRAAGEHAAIESRMRKRENFLGGGKQHLVFSDEPAGAQHGEADLAWRPLAGDAVAPAPLDRCEGNAASFRRLLRRASAPCRTARRSSGCDALPGFRYPNHGQEERARPG